MQIRNGLRKINYYSYMSRAGTNAVKELLAKEDVTFSHGLALTAQSAMEADAKTLCAFLQDCNTEKTAISYQEGIAVYSVTR